MEHQQPAFCTQCGEALPPNAPRFCVVCGAAVRPGVAQPHETQPTFVSSGPTVRLANARVEQAVIGGTIKLASAAAIPPGMWFQNAPPDADQVIAIYAPLRAIVGGWSATTSDGWRKINQTDTQGGRGLVSFETVREWFPAAGRGANWRLLITIQASSFAEEGRTRRGFTYRAGSDPPMEVCSARWTGGRGEAPALPQIQVMAPPRIKRMSDFYEPIRHMNARDANLWAKAGSVQGVYRLPDTSQQRTPVGRGLPLPELFGGEFLRGITGRMFPPFRVQILRPLLIRIGEWPQIERQIQSDAAKLGLDLGTDAATEWWLDQHGHDGAVFERGAHEFAPVRTAIVFRRSQVVAIQE